MLSKNYCNPMGNSIAYYQKKSGLTVEEFAKASGISRNYFYDLKTEKKALNSRVASRMATVAGCEVADLYVNRDRPASHAPLRESPAKAYEYQRIDDYADVRVYDVRGSAGDGALVDEESVKYKLQFRRSWLKKITSAPPDKLAIIEVDGDSMSPTLCDGDSVLVDRTQRSATADGIYALRFDDHLVIKRLQYNPANSTVSLISDNKAYRVYEDIDPASIKIVGRVLWLSRKL